MTNSIQTVAGVRMSDAQMEALSIINERNTKGGVNPRHIGRVRVVTLDKLAALGLVVPDHFPLALTELGQRVVAELPDWDWA